MSGEDREVHLLGTLFCAEGRVEFLLRRTASYEAELLHELEHAPQTFRSGNPHQLALRLATADLDALLGRYGPLARMLQERSERIDAAARLDPAVSPLAVADHQGEIRG